MRDSRQVYESVAENCSAFEARPAAQSVLNSTGCGCNCNVVSCDNCRHFDEDEYCKLDLYDQIVRDHNISK